MSGLSGAVNAGLAAVTAGMRGSRPLAFDDTADDGSPGGIAPPGSHGTERDSLPSLRSSHLNPAQVSVGLDLLTRLLPDSPPGRPVARANKPRNEPAPSLHPHYRSFPATTSRSASRRRDGTQRLRYPPLTRSLSPTRHATSATGGRYRHRPSHVPCRSRRPGSRRLHAGHHLANTRAPARPIPEALSCPRFDADEDFSTRQQRFAYAHLPGPHLTPHRAPFLIAHHDGRQPTQHEAV